MEQGWLNVAGVTSDIIGFLLFAREWRLAIAPARLAWVKSEKQAFTELVGRGPAARFSEIDQEYHRRYLDAWNRETKALEALLGDGEERVLFPKRQWAFNGGKYLVVFGFVLQALGSWPGGWPSLSITP